MEERHLDDVAALEALCFAQPWSREGLAAELKKPGAVFLVAREAGQTLGYLGLNTVLDEGYIANLAVHPDSRRRGLGRQLLAAMVEEGRRRGLSFITLEVRPSNTAALALYRSLGFAQAGLRRGFYHHPAEDGLLMTYYYNRNGATE